MATKKKPLPTMKPAPTTDKVEITNVPIENKRKLKAIVSHLGVDLSSFLKMKLVEIIKGYPEHMHIRKQ